MSVRISGVFQPLHRKKGFRPLESLLEADDIMLSCLLQWEVLTAFIRRGCLARCNGSEELWSLTDALKIMGVAWISSMFCKAILMLGNELVAGSGGGVVSPDLLWSSWWTLKGNTFTIQETNELLESVVLGLILFSVCTVTLGCRDQHGEDWFDREAQDCKMS